jgi:hypothetical protein
MHTRRPDNAKADVYSTGKCRQYVQNAETPEVLEKAHRDNRDGYVCEDFYSQVSDPLGR